MQIYCCVMRFFQVFLINNQVFLINNQVFLINKVKGIEYGTY